MDDQFKVPSHHDSEPVFKSPEQAAAADPSISPMPLVDSPKPNVETSDHMPKKKRKIKFWPPNKFGWIIIALVLVILSAVGYWYFKIHKTVKTNLSAISTPAPQTVASSLTGLQVSPATNKLPITAIMIENSTDARPQSGLSQAGVVFEAIAEGGITRFVALYQSNSASLSVGPVRSARPYFISWMLGFDAAYAHVGGSPEALSDISSWSVKNMDQFSNGSYYQRVSSHAAPHNVYTSLASLYKLEQSKGYTSSSFTSWPRKIAKPLTTPTAKSISFSMSGPAYNVSYSYNASANSYTRSDGGSPQIDANTNQAISVPVVIAVVVPRSNGPLDTSGSYYSEYQTVGSGTAYIFQDGGVTVGQWAKSSNNSQITFSTTAGQSLALDPGETWVTAVSSTSAVSYQ